MSHQMSTGNSHINTRLTLKEKYFFKKLKLYIWYYSTLNKYKQNCVVYIWYYSLGISTGSFFSLPAACLLFSRGWLSRALAFCSLFYPWLLWLSLTTRSLRQGRQLVDFAGFRDFNNCSSDLIMIYSSHFFYSTLWSWIASLPVWLRPCWAIWNFSKLYHQHWRPAQRRFK